MQLRPYQVKMIDDVREMMHEGTKRILLQSPTGSGKTLIMAHMAKTAEAQGMTTWFLVHRRELVRQSVKAFEALGIRPGVLAAGWPMRSEAKTQICSVQLLRRRFSRMKSPTLIAPDECHHMPSNTYQIIGNHYRDAFFVGLTATPQRLDGKGLGFFQKMVLGPPVSKLIEDGYLCPYRLYAPSTIDLSNVPTRMGDYARKELSEASDKPTITGDAIKEYLKLANGKRAVVFCTSIEHSKHVVEQFRAAGIPAEHVDGSTPLHERDAAIRRFENAITRVISNVELFGEGFDVPGIECAILLRPTRSLTLYLQQIGRALRPSDGKGYATILDHAGNCQRHGLPDDDREWSLDGGRKAKAGSTETARRIRICPSCYAANSRQDICSYCGFRYPIDATIPEHQAGELTEVDIAQARKRKEIERTRAQSYEELVELGRSRNYPNPAAWARHVYQGRRRRVAGQ